MNNLILFAIPFIVLMIYLIRKENKDKLTRRNEIEFKNVDETMTFNLDFNEQKDGSLMAIKHFQTKQFGAFRITIYKGAQYCEDNLNCIKVEKVLKGSGFAPAFIGDLTDDDLIIIFTLIKKL
tara:strand:+ start:354 stop:722 length:369 start_codon:yes stop_codon:yes gene_type:complete